MKIREDINTARPLVMHVDLNSCFATVEQQARVRLRGRPVAVVNRRAETATIITASYEAKAHGVKLGMRFRDARLLCPDIIGVETDPPKYKYVYKKLMTIMNSYSASVVMKSIDEGVMDFSQSPLAIRGRDLEETGREIKQRLRNEVGVAMRCNVGIGTNRFLAKTAAGLHKPDGMDVITSDNLRQVYSSMKLVDLNGIAERNRSRLESVGINRPIDFLDASEEVLRTMVFMSVNGTLWHQRLRGWEVDDNVVNTKTIGRQYVLESFHLSFDEILKRLHHLCESVGERLRGGEFTGARGIYVGCHTYGNKYTKAKYWHKQLVLKLPFYSNEAIYNLAKQMFMEAPPDIRDINIHVYLLHEDEISQINLFADELAREKSMSSAVDNVNIRYGGRTIHSADTLGTDFYVKSKIPFGGLRYL